MGMMSGSRQVDLIRRFLWESLRFLRAGIVKKLGVGCDERIQGRISGRKNDSAWLHLLEGFGSVLVVLQADFPPIIQTAECAWWPFPLSAPWSSVSHGGTRARPASQCSQPAQAFYLHSLGDFYLSIYFYIIFHKDFSVPPSFIYNFKTKRGKKKIQRHPGVRNS